MVENGSRQWARADATRQGLLEAARAVFAARGYAEASVAEIVERSSTSVGSLYHHYGGKPGLYLALWESYANEQEVSAAAAVSHAKEAGEKEPIALFIAGARAFLEVCWKHREIARIFHEGEGPADFGLLRRRRSREWVRQNTRLLRVDDEGRGGQVLVMVLTAAIGGAAREVATAEGRSEATEIIDEVGRILVRLSQEPV